MSQRSVIRKKSKRYAYNLGNVNICGGIYPYEHIAGYDNISQFLDTYHPVLDANKEGLISFDIETYPKKKYLGIPEATLLPKTANIRTLQFWHGPGNPVYILDFLEVFGFNETRNCLEDGAFFERIYNVIPTYKGIAHNALFETAMVQSIAQEYNIIKPLCIRCTQILFRLLLCANTPESKGISSSLAALTKHLFKFSLPKEIDHSVWGILFLQPHHLDYCARDAIMPYLIYTALMPLLREKDMEDIYALNCMAQEPVAHMRINGIAIDEPKHDELITTWKYNKDEKYLECMKLLNNKRVEELTLDLYADILFYKVAGGESIKALVLNTIGFVDRQLKDTTLTVDIVLEDLEKLKKAADAVRGDAAHKRELRAYTRAAKNLENYLISVDSGKQLSDWLKSNLPPSAVASWPKTEKSEQLKTDEEALKDNIDLPLVEPLLEYKKASKMYSTYGIGLKDYILHGKIYPQYTLGYTTTGRTSAFKPALQQCPRDSELRAIFVPRGSNRVMICADYSQIELRIAAIISEDQVMTEVYEKGEDIHATLAAKIYRKPIDKITKEERSRSKNISFSNLFGGGSGSYQRYSKRASGITVTDKEAQKAVDTFRETFAQFREWQQLTARYAEKNLSIVSPLGKIRALTEDNTYSAAINHPIQAGAAEIKLKALVNVWQHLIEYDVDCFIVLDVHDEIVLDCAKKHSHHMRTVLEKCMIDAFLWLFPEGCIKDLVECNIGANWGEAK